MGEKLQKDQEYRALLVQTWQKAQDDFDKSILSLSGGALGVSFVFLKDIVGAVGAQHPRVLFGAWLCWGTSTATTLLSFLTSKRALGQQIKDLDAEIAGAAKTGIVRRKTNRALANLVRAKRWCFSARGLNFCTGFFNSLAAILFLAGLVLMIIFTSFNLEALTHVNAK